MKEVSNGCGWIPTRSHAIEIFFEVGGGDSSVLSVKVSKKSNRFTLTKLGDAMFESGNVFSGHLLLIKEIIIIQYSQ